MFWNDEEKTMKEKFEDFKESNKTKLRYLAIGGAIGGVAALAVVRQLAVKPQLAALKADTDALWNAVSISYENQLELLGTLKQHNVIDDYRINGV